MCRCPSMQAPITASEQSSNLRVFASSCSISPFIDQSRRWLPRIASCPRGILQADTVGRRGAMDEVLTERVGRTSVVTISRPEARNALTRGVLRSVKDAFETATRDPEVRVVVLTGAGGHFCAGADLRKSFAQDPDLLANLETYMDED